jgi:hypothetical protein
MDRAGNYDAEHSASSSRRGAHASGFEQPASRISTEDDIAGHGHNANESTG